MGTANLGRLLTCSRRLFSTTRSRSYLDLPKPKRVKERVGRNRQRIDISNPVLCDDVLSYIGPSLTQLKGCDIIDINPGTGVWSSKLHEALTPRSHILVEPDAQFYEPYIKHFLEKPGSTYKHVALPPELFSTYNNLFDDGHLPYQNVSSSHNDTLSQQNNTLLVTGVFARRAIEKGIRFSSMALQIICKFCVSAWQRELFQRDGSVRMLIWVADEEKSVILPRFISFRKKYSMIVDSTYNIHEVAGLGYSAKKRSVGRRPYLLKESAEVVLERMNGAGLQIPRHRQERWHANAIRSRDNPSDEPSLDELDIRAGVSAMSAQKLRELKGLTERLQNGTIKKYLVDPGNTVRRGPDNPEYLNLRYWSNILKTQTRIMTEFASYTDINDKIIEIEELLYTRSDLSDVEKEAYEGEMKRLMEQYAEAKLSLDDQNLGRLKIEADDRRSVRLINSPLMWDNRPFEPLLLDAEEFDPPKALSLLDFRPKPIPPHVEKNTLESLMDFLQPFSMYLSSDVCQTMEAVAPGASQLIRDVSAVMDPGRGGRMDITNLRTRMLTPEMISGLHQAFIKWPFRPLDSDSHGYFTARHNTPSVA